MITVLIADDEVPALNELEHLLRSNPQVGEIVRASSGAEVIRILSQRTVDAAFLDIHMPGLSGLDLARALNNFVKRPAIVFVTADADRAVEAFDVSAIDYLLKPVRIQRLQSAIERILERSDIAPEIAPTAAIVREPLTISAGGTTTVLAHNTVRWVQAQGDYSRVVTAGSSQLVRTPISELEQRWSDTGFVRIHRSLLVNATLISALHLRGSSPTVTIFDTELPVSRRLLSAVRPALERYSLEPE